ncbi:MAG: hypothetical protein M3Q61_03105 [Chloroflexota bacterium]|nr:hypothetical protein [Chloroflexota bacterium]
MSVVSQQVRPPVVSGRVDLVRAFQRVEESGGRELRLAWERSRRAWSADASTAIVDGATLVNIIYIAQDSGERAQFRYDPRSDTVTRP